MLFGGEIRVMLLLGNDLNGEISSFTLKAGRYTTNSQKQ